MFRALFDDEGKMFLFMLCLAFILMIISSVLMHWIDRAYPAVQTAPVQTQPATSK